MLLYKHFRSQTQMNEIKLDLESKYAELGNLVGDLNIFYKDPEHLMGMQYTENQSKVVTDNSLLNSP